MIEYKTIRELCSIVVDCPHSTPKWTEDGKIVVRNNNIKNGRINLTAPSFTDDEHFRQRIKRARPQSGDLIITREAPIGEVGMIPANIECCLGQRMVLLRVDQSICDNFYLLYSLQSPYVKNQISWSEGTGTTVSNLRIPHLENIKIPYIPLELQKRVSSVLRVIEEKIFNNSKINENLADQAQAIYQQYFLIEADPNWPLGHLSDLIDVKYGKDHKKLADGVYPVYGSGGIMRYVERPLYEKESVLIPRKGTLNNVMYVNQPFWSVDTMFYTEMKQANVAKFVYHFVKSKDLASMNSGSAVPSMTTAILNALELRIPSAEALLQFENSVAPMYEMMKKNENQSRKLTELRDALLPKLMSGEIDISSLNI